MVPCHSINAGLVIEPLRAGKDTYTLPAVIEFLCSQAKHPAGTSKDSDICDLSNISDIKICIVGNGNIHIFKDPAYLSKDLGEIYI